MPPKQKKKKIKLCCSSIFLTLELHNLSIQPPFCKSTRVVCHFFFVDHPIILDGVDKMRDHRIARWKRPCSMALYCILTQKEHSKREPIKSRHFGSGEENSKKTPKRIKYLKERVRIQITNKNQTLSLFQFSTIIKKVMKKRLVRFSNKTEIFQITPSDRYI